MKQSAKNVKGYYNPKTIDKFSDALRDAVKDVKAGTVRRVSISRENTKMGPVASVSLVPFLSCPGRCAGTCGPKCYAAKIANLRPSALTAYSRNLALAIYEPETYWNQVNAAVCSVRFFRFHVSGDILNAEYFAHMVETARNNPKTDILVFTKQYETVNAWISENGEIPENLHILFSGWENLDPVNPYDMPETNVYKDETEMRPEWIPCGGNCFECAVAGSGCWTAKRGDTIAFKLH